jgi:hypothetical protein
MTACDSIVADTVPRQPPSDTTSCAILTGGTTVPVHQGRDVAKGILRGILSDVGMTIKELQRLL